MIGLCGVYGLFNPLKEAEAFPLALDGAVAGRRLAFHHCVLFAHVPPRVARRLEGRDDVADG